MTLEPGRTLAHYEIIRLLGKGGMGEVYVARDQKLGRRVALKVLPEELASERERRARFEREAKAVAALKHPNIVTLHSIEEAEGMTLLVMELVEGKPLSEAIPAGGIPLDGFLEIASRWPTPSLPRMPGGSFTATSNRQTCWSTVTAARRSSTSASPRSGLGRCARS